MSGKAPRPVCDDWIDCSQDGAIARGLELEEALDLALVNAIKAAERERTATTYLGNHPDCEWARGEAVGAAEFGRRDYCGFSCQVGS